MTSPSDFPSGEAKTLLAAQAFADLASQGTVVRVPKDTIAIIVRLAEWAGDSKAKWALVRIGISEAEDRIHTFANIDEVAAMLAMVSKLDEDKTS